MISKATFQDNFQEHAELYGWRMAEKRLSKIFFYLNEQEFRDSDLIEGLRRYEMDDFKFAEFQRTMRTIRGERIEREQRDKQLREEDELREWWRDHSGSRQTCINEYNCSGCKRTFCDIVSKECGKMIKLMLTDEIKGDKAHQILANKFKGLNFEKFSGVEAF